MSSENFEFLKENILRYIPVEGHDALLTDAEKTEFLLDNCEISFADSNTFFCHTELVRNQFFEPFKVITSRFKKEFPYIDEEHYNDLARTNTLQMVVDFGHTCPNWEDVISLGFVGLKKRVEEAAEKAGDDEQKKRFFKAALRQYNAAERFIKRAISEAEKAEKWRIARGLSNLLVAPPSNLFEAFQMILLHYFLQDFTEQTWIRTFGRLDSLLYPFYENTDSEEAKKLVSAFLAEINDHGVVENQPLALGGTDENGNDLTNELSFVFIDEYRKKKFPCVKIHIICAKEPHEEFLKFALDGVREGANSICFFSDEVLKKSLIRLGIAPEDTFDYHIDGCYECGGRGEITCPGAGRVNVAKAIELALNDGKDVLDGCQLGLPVLKKSETFDEFYAEYLRQVEYILESTKKYIAAMEEKYPRLHTAPFFTSTFGDYVKAGKDVFASFGAKYNNTSICCIGLATVVDSLMAVKKLVYDDKSMTLSELSELMRNNWEGHEKLRITVKKKFPKYGMGDKTVDKYAADLAEKFAKIINAVPNARGGVYRLGLHSITVRWQMGACLAATPDGRLAGESTSLNTSASFGADREGATGHILSVTEIDATNAPNSVTLDLDLHSSAVKGDNGLHALYSTLKTYLDRGGFSVHYNVLDTAVLKDAQKNPENYPNLQVRLCGWNELFANLPKEQQDEYIARSERE